MFFQFDLFSFSVGFAAATIIWVALITLLPTGKNLLEQLKSWQGEQTNHSQSRIKSRYLHQTYLEAQSAHLASSLLPLKDILIEPALLAPPKQIEPQEEHFHQDIFDTSIPYLIQSPELSAFYNAPSMTVQEAASGNANLVLIGPSGVGKTTALAHLASTLTQSEDSSDNSLPLFIHISEILESSPGIPGPEKLLTALVKKYTPKLSGFSQKNLKDFFESTLANGEGLLLLDGIDELPPQQVNRSRDWLQNILDTYPQVQIICTGSNIYLGGILSLGFTPIALLPWNQEKQNTYLEKWHIAWCQLDPTLNKNDAQLLKAWCKGNNLPILPMEYVLKVWAAYAGDATGSLLKDNLLTHLQRLLTEDITAEQISSLAQTLITQEKTTLTAKEIQQWAQNSTLPADTKKSFQSGTSIARLIVSGLFTGNAETGIHFSHPLYLSCLASLSLKDQPPSVQGIELLRWVSYAESLIMFGQQTNPTDIIHQLLALADPYLKRPQFLAAQILRYTPREFRPPWDIEVNTWLLSTFQSETAPDTIRAQAFVHLLYGADRKIPAILKTFLLSPSEKIRQYGALGCGMLHDTSSIDDLIRMVEQPINPIRSAVCLALGEIGNQDTLEALAYFLSRGNEHLRIFAAESLSRVKSVGHITLQEALHNSDILVRRAAVFALSLIPDTWAKTELEKIQTQDEQWAVRNLAIEVLRNPPMNRRLPAPPVPASEKPWVLQYAARQGLGVPAGELPIQLLLMAVNDPSPDYNKPALEFLATAPTTETWQAILQCLTQTDASKREAGFQVMANLIWDGNSLPN